MSINHTTELTAADRLIESLTLDINCMQKSLDADRKADAERVKWYTAWLDSMIEIEALFPIGSDSMHAYKSCKLVFEKLVAK